MEKLCFGTRRKSDRMTLSTHNLYKCKASREKRISNIWFQSYLVCMMCCPKGKDPTAAYLIAQDRLQRPRGKSKAAAAREDLLKLVALVVC